jgi:hypothetical protein
VVALDHVDPHRGRVVDDAVDEGLQLGELVDVVTERLRHPLDRGRAVRVLLQPHHLGLGSRPEVEAGRGLEVGLDPLEVRPAVGGQERPRVLPLLTVAEAGAPHARGLRVPGERHERLGLRNADELGRLGPVADVVAVAVGEEVRRRPVDELEALRGHRLPVPGRDALPHDPAGDRDELVVDVLDPLGVDAPADVLHELVAALGADEAFEVGRHGLPSFSLCLYGCS